MIFLGIQIPFQNKNTNFKSNRINKNAVAQLARNNRYSLTEPNQRRIKNAITALAKIPGEKNIKFLLNTAAKSTYSTNIVLGENKPKTDWKGLLLTAVASAVAITPFIKESDFSKKITKLSKQKFLTPTEKEIVELRNNLLKTVDIKQIEEEAVGTEKDFKKNLDYFIVSSETTLEHKKYVLEKLNYLMSPEYKINKDLEDKKSLVAAEIVNDITISVPDNKIPNIKSVNQKTHGICAEISVVRKKLVYEDKPNYIDSLLSELDDSDSLVVYDRTKLGSGEKIAVTKTPVDYKEALAKGFRIIDAASMVWMQAASLSGYTPSSYSMYNAFDGENFDVYNDTFLNTAFTDPELASMQKYYQALLVLDSEMKSYKSACIKKSISAKHSRLNSSKYVKEMADTILNLKQILGTYSKDKKQIDAAISGLLKLEYTLSKKIDTKNRYAYIPNEETSVKREKISGYLKEQLNCKVNTNDIDRVYDAVQYYHEVLNSFNKADTRISELAKVQNLYSIAAKYRHQFILGLENEPQLNKLIIREKLTNKEALYLNTIDSLISKIETNSPDSKLIVEQLSKSLNSAQTPEAVLENLKLMKETSEYHLTETLDNIYASVSFGDRKSALILYIDDLINQLKNNSNAPIKNDLAKFYGINNYSKTVIQALAKTKESLLTGGEKEFNAAFDILCDYSQIKTLKSALAQCKKQVESDSTGETIKELGDINSISEPDADKINSLFDLYDKQLSDIENDINKNIQKLRVVDETGHVLYSADPKDLIIKKYENIGEIASERVLKLLKEHLDRITKAKSSDEFNSRQNKIKDKDLYKFTPEEKNLIDITANRLDGMYANVQKSLIDVRRAIQSPMEELSRLSGVDSGKWWVKEGTSGLMSGQQIRVLEYITGIPYHISKDLKGSINKIKNSPYSGISTSSVFDDRIGMHAQYIADIEPVKVKNSDGTEETREILFHDNTWGACEHDNTWIDSKGFLRTDYSDRRGGKLGYVTDDMYRNGNFVDRVLGDMKLEEKADIVDNKIYKKIVGKNPEEYKSAQYEEILIDGNSSDLDTIADNIKDLVFNPHINYIDKMPGYVKDLSESEIEEKISGIFKPNASWKTTYERIKKRIFSDFASHQLTEEEYQNLPDDDILKVTLEKIALKSNYSSLQLLEEISKAKNVKDLDRFVKMQRRHALASLRYIFNKDEFFVDYFVNSMDDGNKAAIFKILDKYGLKIDDETYEDIFETIVFDSVQSQGSLKNGITSIIDDLAERLDGIIENENAKTDLKNYMKTLLKERLYFNKSDISNDNLAGVIKFIDRVYKPEDDDELVSVFRQIQDMTKDEFRAAVTSKITNEELGIKNNTGWTVLKRLLQYDEDTENSLLNQVYFDTTHALDDIIYKPHYTYNRFNRTLMYSFKDNFNTAYRLMKQSLELLTLPKLFNKYKEQNIKQYQAYPAYPAIDYISAININNLFNFSIGEIPKLVREINRQKYVQYFCIKADELFEFVKAHDPNEVPTEEDYNSIIYTFGNIYTKLYSEEEQKLKTAADLSLAGLNLDENTKYKDIQKIAKKLVTCAKPYKKTVTDDTIKEIAEENSNIISQIMSQFTTNFIQERYRPKFNELINKYISCLKAENHSEAEYYLNTIWDMYNERHLLNNPQEVLDLYIKSLATDTKISENAKVNYKTMLQNLLTYSRLIEMQAILMDALNDGTETAIKTAFDDILIEMKNGDSYKMSSPEILTQMVDQLIVDTDTDTAQKFVEKLGLNDEYVSKMLEIMDFNNIKENIAEANKNTEKFQDFARDVEDCKKAAQDELEDGVKPIRVYNHLRKSIINLIKQYEIDKEYTKPLRRSLSELKKEILAAAKAFKPKEAFDEKVSRGMFDMANALDEDGNVISQNINSSQILMKLICSIPLKPNSDVFKGREDLIKKWDDFTKYCDTCGYLQREE